MSPAILTTVYSICNATNLSSPYVKKLLGIVVWYKLRPSPMVEDLGKADLEDKIEVLVEVKVKELKEKSEEEEAVPPLIT